MIQNPRVEEVLSEWFDDSEILNQVQDDGADVRDDGRDDERDDEAKDRMMTK